MSTTKIPLAMTSGTGALAAGNTAADVPFTPTGGIAATTAQAAIAETDTEKAVLGEVADVESPGGTSYTLDLGDKGKVLRMTNGSANVVTVPLNSVVAFPINTVIVVEQDGAGQTAIAAAGGVTIRSLNSYLKCAGRYGWLVLVKVATNEWLLSGALAA